MRGKRNITLFKGIQTKQAPSDFFNAFANWEVDKGLSEIASLVYTLYMTLPADMRNNKVQVGKSSRKATLPPEYAPLLSGYKEYCETKYSKRSAQQYLVSVKLLIKTAIQLEQPVSSAAVITSLLDNRKTGSVNYTRLVILHLRSFFKYKNNQAALSILKQYSDLLKQEVSNVTEQV